MAPCRGRSPLRCMRRRSRPHSWPTHIFSRWREAGGSPLASAPALHFLLPFSPAACPRDGIGSPVDSRFRMGWWLLRDCIRPMPRSEEHTYELQSLMRISNDVFCLKKQKIIKTSRYETTDYNK